ncbi:MAG: hypothetical protein OIN66_01260 [Candidatus Methanoperedens sp.]|nr:hypothetical protein [Candidatus Methanoperedens sp.]
MQERIKYLEETVEIISIAIARERASIKYYTEAHQKAITENARRIFSLLIEQEKGHEAHLRAYLHEIKSEIELERLKLKK